MSSRKIVHVDMDAFYASVEQRDNPALRGRPVAVGHGAKRGVVAASSYEARGFGVRSAMPSTTAMRLCAELVFVPPRFDVYRAVSRQINAIFADYTALIEPLSLDEAYLDVTEDLHGLSSASATAKEIRTRIFNQTSLTASAGISYNKFLAKLASTQRKPNGQFVITPEVGDSNRLPRARQRAALDRSKHRGSSVLAYRAYGSLSAVGITVLFAGPAIAVRNIRLRRVGAAMSRARSACDGRRKNVAVTGARPDRDSDPPWVSGGIRVLGDAVSLDSHDIAEAEITAIPPHAMEQHGEFAGDSDYGFAPTDPVINACPQLCSRQGRAARRSRTFAASNG